MAIRDEAMPVHVVVFCDSCGDETDHDYLVPAGTDSLTVARNYLAEHEGWSISPCSDLCPTCKPCNATPATTDPWDEWDETPEGGAALERLQADLDLLPPLRD